MHPLRICNSPLNIHEIKNPTTKYEFALCTQTVDFVLKGTIVLSYVAFLVNYNIQNNVQNSINIITSININNNTTPLTTSKLSSISSTITTTTAWSTLATTKKNKKTPGRSSSNLRTYSWLWVATAHPKCVVRREIARLKYTDRFKNLTEIRFINALDFGRVL